MSRPATSCAPRYCTAPLDESVEAEEARHEREHEVGPAYDPAEEAATLCGLDATETRRIEGAETPLCHRHAIELDGETL